MVRFNADGSKHDLWLGVTFSSADMQLPRYKTIENHSRELRIHVQIRDVGM